MTDLRPRGRIGCDDAGVPLVGQIDAKRRFHITFQARQEDIDELGHVTNATWVSWLQDASVAHWIAAARPVDVDAYVAIVLRHEIDYRGNIQANDETIAVTWVEGQPRGARYTRRVDFADSDGRLLVTTLSTWALIDKPNRRLVRVPPEVAAPFLYDPVIQ